MSLFETTVKHKQFENKTLALAYSELISMLKKAADIRHTPDGNLEIEFKICLNQGFSVILDRNNLVFNGAGPTEILYAVYDLAEKVLGYCFFEPGTDICDPPEKIVLEQGYVIENTKPLLSNRGLIQEFAFSDGSYSLADWMAKNKLNYLLTHMKYYDQLSNDLKEYFSVRGITIESGHHIFDYWIPAHKYYKKHPEYFAIINGERIVPYNDNGYLKGGQLCATDPGVRREIAKNMIAYCKEHPEANIISLVPNDGFGWCECEHCSKFYDKSRRGQLYCLSEHVYPAQELYHDMVRDVAAQVRAVIPSKTVTFVAYVNYVEPSKNFILNNNMAVHVAPYWRCVNHRIYDRSCPINSMYIEAIQKWTKTKNGGHINIYEYYMGVNLYVSLPLVHHEDVFDEAAFYSQNGIDGLLTQFQMSHWTAYGLNYYCMAKALYGSGKESVNSTLQKLFGPAFEDVGCFYSEMKKLVLSAGNCHITYPRALFNRTQLASYEYLHSCALAIAQKIPDNKFVQGFVIWTEYLLRFKNLFDLYHRKTQIDSELRDFLDWARQHKNDNVFVFEKLQMLIGKWQESIKSGRSWLHFNLDWEDEYIRKHDTLLR